MKGLILSGGRGTRLRPITHTNAKQLIPIANKPVLFYGIEAIRDAGITDIGIVVGDTREEIKCAVGDGSEWDVNVTYIEQDAPLGLAHAVLVSEKFLKGDEFVMYLGDNLIIGGISDLVAGFNKRKPNSQILLVKVPNPQSFGVAELKGGKVVSLAEKPSNPKTDLALVGVYMFDDTIFKAVKAIKPSQRGELEITDAIQWLIDNGYNVEPHLVNGWWKDTGMLDDLLEANKMVLDSFETNVKGFVDHDSLVEFKVIIEEGAEIINSTVRGPAIIGKATKVINSFVGPFTSISYGCRLENCEVEHSIVLEESSIKDLKQRIVDSLIGKNVKIGKSPFKPRAYRFMLGDSSEVGIL
jgi:glucose-1-phosphate thymidylyltransferase